MSFFIRNLTASAIEINDLGLTIDVAEDLDLKSETHNSIALSTDLVGFITAGDIVILDPADGVTRLSTVDSLKVLDITNGAPYGLAPGAMMFQLEDVNLQGPAHDYVLTYNSITGMWEPKQLPVPASISPPAICYRYNGYVTQTFTSAYSTIIIGSDIKTDALTYTVINNEVTVLKSGWYKIVYGVSATAARHRRSSMEHVLEKNGVEIQGSHAYSYHRKIHSGADTATAVIWVNLTANDMIRVRSKELTGNTITKTNACRLILEYYG